MNHPKFNLWSDSRSEFTPTPDPSPKLGEGRKTGDGILRVLHTRKIPSPEIIPPFPMGRGSKIYRPQGDRQGGMGKKLAHAGH